QQTFRLHAGQEWLTAGGFILSYLALGSSRYQLPHYIFVAFPLAAIMVAALLKDFFEVKRFQHLHNIFRPVQWATSFLLPVAALLTVVYVFPAGVVWVILWTAALGVLLFIAFNKSIKPKMFWLSVAAIMLSNFFLTNHFYYRLMDYQLGNQLAEYIEK